VIQPIFNSESLKGPLDPAELVRKAVNLRFPVPMYG
jgi:hypothetical protein